jgi:hypothetical protein
MNGSRRRSTHRFFALSLRSVHVPMSFDAPASEICERNMWLRSKCRSCTRRRTRLALPA